MKILMVCLGNICRSPLAEGVLRHKANERGIHVTVDSCGTSNYHIGQEPDSRSVENALKNGVDISSLRARQFSKADFEHFDRIFVMDQSNHNNVMALATNEIHRNKVDLFLNILQPGSNRAVPDPYFGGAEGFQHVFDLIDEACEKLLDELHQQ
jgi:protein-tyrosine phosphatase